MGEIMQMIAKARRAVSIVFLTKAIAGFAITALALFGVTMPHLGIELTPLNQGAAATVGGVIGAILALKG